MKCRVRTVLLVLGLASSLLIFSSVRCALFSLSCSGEEDPFHDLLPAGFDKNNQDVQKFFQNGRDFSSNVGSNNSSSSLSVNETQPLVYQSYLDALQRRADRNKVIVLVSTDFGYIHMALNLYFTSLKKLNIDNYLYLSSDAEAAEVLKKHGIAHYMMAQDKDGKSMSAYGTAAFRRKTHIKTKIILEALKLGFTVLIVDVDIVFLKNPFPFLSCGDCDIQIQSDGSEGNSGFYLARPTKSAITLHKVALQTAARSPGLSNQKAVDRAMERMSRQGKIKIKMLSTEQFPHGNAYFERGHRMFAGDNPCQICVIVHNNWIVSGVAKEYRFKEHLMWLDDSGAYYSDPNAKYLIYNNPHDFGEMTTSMETDTLRGALAIGHLLKRIVVLPAFHCYGCRYESCRSPNKTAGKTARCSLNTHIRISTFNKAFPNAYREHVFLRHPYIPKTTLASQSETILIKSDEAMSKLAADDMKSIKHQFTPADTANGASSTEIHTWLDPLSSFKVLRFHSLYKAFGKFHPQHANNTFEYALKRGLVKADYRQY